MNKLPISLCIFSSTRGHHGRTDLHKETLNRLDIQVPISYFGQAIAHIKALPESADLMGKMIEDFKFYKVDVELSGGYWKHFDSTHNTEYLKDIIKMSELLTQPYTLFLEDDWVFIQKDLSILELFCKAISLLESDKDILSVRFPRNMDDNNHVHGVEEPGTIFNKNGYIYSFNPHICRTNDLYRISSIVKNNFKELSFHCEHGFTRAASLVSRKTHPFYAFKPEIVQAYHIGEPPFESGIPS